MTKPTDPPDGALWALLLAALTLEALAYALRPLLAHGAALVLALLQRRPKVQPAPAAEPEVLAADCIPAPRPVARGKATSGRRRTRTAATVKP